MRCDLVGFSIVGGVDGRWRVEMFVALSRKARGMLILRQFAVAFERKIGGRRQLTRAVDSFETDLGHVHPFRLQLLLFHSHHHFRLAIPIDLFQQQATSNM